MEEGEGEEQEREEQEGAGPTKGVGNLDMSLDMTGALKVLVNTGGRKVSSKAKQVSKDAYLGFLLLRHLRIRDLRTRVRGLLRAGHIELTLIRWTLLACLPFTILCCCVCHFDYPLPDCHCVCHFDYPLPDYVVVFVTLGLPVYQVVSLCLSFCGPFTIS